jgi:hypothetical protein
MRKLSTAAVATILAIAFYFAVFWGYDGLRMFTSPTFGLEEVWRSQFIFDIGRLFALSPVGLIKLAAFFAVLKLAVAGICAVQIAQRFRALAGGKAESEIFEAGLILAALISMASLGPAAWSHNVELVRAQIVPLMLAGVAAGLSFLERGYGRVDAAQPRELATAVPQGGTWFTPFRAR